MLLGYRAPLAAMLLFVSTAVGLAQDGQLRDWLTVPAQEAGLVLVINAGISAASITDEKGTPVNVTKWNEGIPFVQQYRMEPGVYQFRFQGLISSVAVVLKSGALTYLRLSANPGPTHEANINVSTGRIPSDIVDLAESARGKGIEDAFKVNFIRSDTKVLLLNTDPPWPVPPPPKR